MTDTPPLRVELRGSPALTVITIAVHAAAGAILLVMLPAAAGALAVSALALLAFVAIRGKTMNVAPHAPAALYLGYDGSLAVRLRSGLDVSGPVAARRYVSRWLVVLRLERIAEGHRTILVARDMLAPEAFRRLRLWALWNTLPARDRSAHSSPAAERTISADTCL